MQVKLVGTRGLCFGVEDAIEIAQQELEDNKDGKIVALSEDVDVMFVLGGLHRANTQVPAKLCTVRGTPTFHLETIEDFKPAMVRDRTVAGVTAGASTPEWVIAEFVEKRRSCNSPPVTSRKCGSPYAVWPRNEPLKGIDRGST